MKYKGYSSYGNVLIDVSSWLKINLPTNMFKDSQLSVVVIEIYIGNLFFFFWVDNVTMMLNIPVDMDMYMDLTYNQQRNTEININHREAVP